MLEDDVVDDVFDLDATMDDIEAAPEFMNPSNGHHRFALVKASVKDGTRVNFVYSLQETLELANPDDPETPVGSLTSEGFTAKGQQFLKARLESLLGKDTVKGASMTDLLGMLNGEFKDNYHFTATTKVSTTKGKGDNAGKEYENIRFNNVEVVEAPAS